MLITLTEIFYLAIMSLVLGYIFSGAVKRPRTEYELSHHRGFDWQDYLNAILISAPAVILHELAHKFVAIALGFAASFKIWTFGLILGAFLKFINSPLILFAPGYVSIQGPTPEPASALISLAGPLTNLILFGIAWYLLEYSRLTRKQAILLYLTKQINLFLFIFNMLPIPPLDGFQFFSSLIKMIF
ncbi:MAG: M50 family metallopeptidase [Nanoarchaeota archaeon]